ncbi:MAG: UTP--glucose-1-phosphate uridylyltransferase [Fibrobacterota bacterium]
MDTELKNKYREKMKRRGINETVQTLFLQKLSRLADGDFGHISDDTLAPVPYGSVTKHSELSSRDVAGKEALGRCAVIKLNGGLGTSMGLQGPKSFLPVKEGMRFIDLVIEQIRTLRRKSGAAVPLIFMNSAVTMDETDALIRSTPDLADQSVPASFVHHSYPKVDAATLEPASYPQDPEMEWNPAGHGDIYASLYTSGVLDQLIDAGMEYAFISNVDNLGAVPDTSLLGWFAQENAPFMMEVCRRREMDKKGGHIALRDGQYILRERAQVSKEDQKQFEDVDRYSYFNSNSIWINLKAVRDRIARKGLMELPVIANRKHLNPRDETTRDVFQIETAMGSAISVFEDSRVIEIGQERFRPVKKNNDLFLLRSDRFTLHSGGIVAEDGARTESINVELDSRYYKTYDDLAARLQDVPSLAACTRLTVRGDILFGAGVELIGDVYLENRRDEQIVLKECRLEDTEYIRE